MIYLLSQEWESTRNNHAGMSHMCRLIEKDFNGRIKHICMPPISKKNTRPLFHMLYFWEAVRLCFLLRSTDTLILMEYLNPTRNQFIVAKILKTFRKVKIYALIHLVPSDTEKFYPSTSTKLYKWLEPIDRIITFGNSLTSYLKSRGVNNDIVTSLHYVDHTYYSPVERPNNNRLKAIFMGNMQRDIDALEYIVKRCPKVDFIYCKGRSLRNTNSLECLENIKIYGYLEEDDLKQLMNDCDLSLNLMYDTIGSNVITTSMAMGLVMLVSDVGSIRDYCSEANTFFCKNNLDFVNAINYCANNRDVLNEMKLQSKIISKKFSHIKFMEKIME